MRICPRCRECYPDSSQICARDLSPLLPVGPGSVIRNKYRVESLIAAGGMGAVFRARHLLFNEPKALKLLIDGVNPNSPSTRAFLAESLTMRKLVHPNIVQVEDVDFTDDQILFVVMELIEGVSLQQFIEQNRVVPQMVAIHVAAQACAALSATHSRGIVHRDIKPHNIMLTQPNGSLFIKLIDFGIAKIREREARGPDDTESASGVFKGTVAYASPEQAQMLGSSALDGRSDLYSLGLVLYCMLTGAMPFRANTPGELLMKRLVADPLPLEVVKPDLEISPQLVAVVKKALEREREKRFRSADEMREALLACAAKPQAPRAPQGPTCSICSQLIREEYYYRENRAVCSRCQKETLDRMERGGTLSRAALLGAGALAGVILVWAALFEIAGGILDGPKVSESEGALIVLLVYRMVGMPVAIALAVKHGSGSFGGRKYQVLAFLLLLAALASTLFFPPAAVGQTGLLEMIFLGVSPFIAWQITKRPDLGFIGPLPVETPRKYS